ncbi:LysR substrate-binding domain-containing protein [Microbulbifer halophilus]|uniref:LysR substrate-binding domain-containing protein n=2 Tax=Microbulbifer halophilus TaxID=453963 RepID=A0ABW5ECL5_9GAMM|nr:LysR substrate-binding domain-containing protein [Microbulbifer halophilus]MCW8126945.1 LysR substrate-binding domain-containing protein [Microbulbifer halophilus]
MSEEGLRPASATSHLPSRKALPPFEALRAFDIVARLGGVRKAAQYLCRDHAVISRHLRTIEDRVGCRLIERTPAGALLTEDGARYHKQVSAAIDAIANATIDLMKRNDDHLLYAWCMPGFALQWLVGRLEAFETANPVLDIELRPADTIPDFDRYEADVDIRFAPAYGSQLQLPPSVRTAEIARPPIVPVASPKYLARSPEIEQPRDLLYHQLLHEESYDSWQAWLEAHGLGSDLELSGPRLWHGHLTLDAARRGRGIALTNHFVAAEDLESGQLVEVGAGVAGFERVPLGAYLFMARTDRWNALPVQRFREWLLKTIASESPADQNVVA